MAAPDPRQPGGGYDALVGGLHTVAAMVAHPGRSSGIQVALSPLGARALLGLPAGELASLDLHADVLLGRLPDELQCRLRAAKSWSGRFAACDEVLLRHARLDEQPPRGRSRLAAALDSGGAVSIETLAREVGWSSRHLGGRFNQEIGLTPKAAARVVRFDFARRRLMRRAACGRQPALADLAAAGGYYDQAHLNRDFRAFAGCSPLKWLTDEFRNVQANPSRPVPGLTYD